MESEKVTVTLGMGFFIEPSSQEVTDCVVTQPPTQSELQIINAHGHGATVVPQKAGAFAAHVTEGGVFKKWVLINCEADGSKGPGVVSKITDVIGSVPWASLGKYGGYIAVILALILGGGELRDWWKKRPDPPPIPGPVDPKPPVDPKKPDPPVDPPGPTAAKVTIIVVEDTSLKTPAQASVIMNPMLRASLTKEGHEFELLSVKDPQFQSAGYKAYTDKVGLPAVIVFDSAKLEIAQNPLTVFKVPDAPELFEAQVRKVISK